MPEDEVIIFKPAYDSYQPSIEANGGKVVSIPLEAPNYKINWKLVEESITEKSKHCSVIGRTER